MTRPDIDSLVRRIFAAFIEAALPFFIAIGYAGWVVLGLKRDEAGSILAASATAFVVFALAVPFFLLRSQVESVLSAPARESGAHLSALLALPRRVEMAAMTSVLIGAGVAAGYAVVHLGRSGWVFFELMLMAVALGALLGSRFLLRIEEMLRTEAIAEFHRHSENRVTPAGWFHWPRFVWYLQYVVGSIFVGAVATLGAVVFSRAHQVWTTTLADLYVGGHGDIAATLTERASQLASDIEVPLVVLGLFVAVIAFLTIGQIARRYSQASVRLQDALEAIAAGKPRLPDWIGTDEFGDLAGSLASVLGRLKRMTSTLQSSAKQLAGSAVELGESTTKQNEMLTRQAAAMQETEVTAQEIRQTSVLAAQKTEAVLKTAERAEEISRTGGSAIEQSMAGLTEVRGEVTDMATRIKSLGERARQIASITTTVKDLADQSNMLALNAAIEAVRSGEHGKGFAVVAREIRSLADQSIQATNRVREILDDIGEAIRSTVVITERGVGKVEGSLVQVQSSGESLRELSSIVRDNTQAVRQIAAAVGQQNAGIGQIFEAVSDLSRMMDDTMTRLKTTENAVSQVRQVADEVHLVVHRYGGEDYGAEGNAGAPAGAPGMAA